MALPNKGASVEFGGKGKHFSWSNSWSTSQPRGFAKEMKTNFEKIQEQMTALQ